MRNLSLILLFSFIGSAARAQHFTWKTPDFAIVHEESAALKGEAFDDTDKATCLNNVAAAICLVDPFTGPDPDEKRACLRGGEIYKAPFQDLYLRYPDYLQRQMCHLKKIFIEKKFIGSAYGGLFIDASSKKVEGGLIGIRQALLDTPTSLADWGSWKAQVSFGTDPTRVNSSPLLPLAHASIQDGEMDALYFLIAHEFGHIFDFSNDINSSTPGHCTSDGDTCPEIPKPGSWATFSWKDFATPRPEFDFPLRSGLCFYFCEGKFLTPDKQNEIYSSLSKTNFLSDYTTRYPAEDFADTFAIYVINRELSARFWITTASGEVYDPIERLNSDPLLAAKKNYIENFLASAIKYPGL